MGKVRQALNSIDWPRVAVVAVIAIFAAGGAWTALNGAICSNTKRIERLEQESSDTHDRVIRIEETTEWVKRYLQERK